MVDAAGERLAGRHAVEPTAMFIHAAVHRIAAKACVLHTHMPYATALTLTGERALDTTLSQNAMRFHGRVAVDGTTTAWRSMRAKASASRARWTAPTSCFSATTASWCAASASTTRTTTSTTLSAPACRRCWRRRPDGRWRRSSRARGARRDADAGDRQQSELFFEALRRTL